ncbi:MAG: ABC transporter substrate-binding protein, partial [Actinobacteria bacterium]|nr:ABC transporter substrate-binding protein [Actinomycetota bacterium]
WTVALIPVAAAVALLIAVAAPPGGLPVTRVENADEAAVAPAATPQFTPAAPSEVTSTVPAAAGAHTGAATPVAGRPGAPGAAVSGAPTAVVPVAGSGSGAGPSPATPSPPPNGKAAAGRSASIAASGSPGPAAAPPSGPLRLGVPVPTSGPSSGEGAEVLRAVRSVVDRANNAGGVAGRRVELVAVPTDDDAARADVLTRIDSLVGGFAIDAPAGMPWVMPADVGPTGPDVAAAELAAEQAGAALGADLAARSSNGGTIGAVVAAGPDAGLATGLAKSRPVHTVEAGRNTSCDQEMVALRKRDVDALALAVPPDLARRCAAAAARQGWRPAGGLLLAPSAVYAHLERDLVAQGARSAVALSTPNADDTGSSRFRRSAPGCDSYRSLVSFAAAELAVNVAGASNGALTLTALRDRHWSSDLYDVDGGQHTTSHVVSIRFGRWTNSDARHSPPGARRGVVFPDLSGPLVAMGGDES